MLEKLNYFISNPIDINPYSLKVLHVKLNGTDQAFLEFQQSKANQSQTNLEKKTVILLENLNGLMVPSKKLNGTYQACLEFQLLKANQDQTNFKLKTVKLENSTDHMCKVKLLYKQIMSENSSHSKAAETVSLDS